MFRQSLSLSKCKISEKPVYGFEFNIPNGKYFDNHYIYIYVVKKDVANFSKKITTFIRSVNDANITTPYGVYCKLIENYPKFTGEFMLRNNLRVIMSNGKIKPSTHTNPSIRYYCYGKLQYRVAVDNNECISRINRCDSVNKRFNSYYKFTKPVKIGEFVFNMDKPNLNFDMLDESSLVIIKEGFSEEVVATKKMTTPYVKLNGWAARHDKSISELDDDDMLVYAIEEHSSLLPAKTRLYYG